MSKDFAPKNQESEPTSIPPTPREIGERAVSATPAEITPSDRPSPAIPQARHKLVKSVFENPKATEVHIGPEAVDKILATLMAGGDSPTSRMAIVAALIEGQEVSPATLAKIDGILSDMESIGVIINVPNTSTFLHANHYPAYMKRFDKDAVDAAIKAADERKKRLRAQEARLASLAAKKAEEDAKIERAIGKPRYRRRLVSSLSADRERYGQ